MASNRNALSSLIHGLDLDLLIGFHFHPTYEEGIRIVNIKNTGGELAPIFNVYGNLFQCQPEQLEECYCFTKLKLLGKKVNRTLGDGSRRYWKNIKSEFVRDDNHNFIGWVTKLVLHWDKTTPTEWHILEYRDTERPDAGRWVLCRIYKIEKNNDSGSSGHFVPYIDNTVVPEPVASDIGAGQIYPSASQVSSMWASGAREDMNQWQHYEMGQCSNTQLDWFFNAATYPRLTGEHMNQDQIHGVALYNSQQFTSNTYSIDGTPINTATRTRSLDGCDNYPKQYINTNSIDRTPINTATRTRSPDGCDMYPNQYTNTSSFDGSTPINTTRTRTPDGCGMYPNQYSNTNSIDGIDMYANQYINLNPFSGMDDWKGNFNPDQSFNINQFCPRGL